MSDLIIHKNSGLSLDVTFEGRRATLGFQDMDPQRLLAQAKAELERSQEILFRSRRLAAIALHLAEQRAEEAVAAAEAKAAKAAATRAKNKDPFGHQTLLEAAQASGHLEIISVNIPPRKGS